MKVSTKKESFARGIYLVFPTVLQRYIYILRLIENQLAYTLAKTGYHYIYTPRALKLFALYTRAWKNEKRERARIYSINISAKEYITINTKTDSSVITSTAYRIKCNIQRIFCIPRRYIYIYMHMQDRIGLRNLYI